MAKISEGLVKIHMNASFLGAVQAFIEGTTNPMAIEAHAAHRALLFGQQMGFTRIILERDALSMITKIMKLEPSLSDVGNLVEAAKDLMKSFSWWKIQYVKRKANEAAHYLAKFALTIDEGLYWVEDCLGFLIPVLSNDCNTLSQ